MMLAVLFLPFLAGILSFLVPWTVFRRQMLVFVSFAHLAGSLALWFFSPEPALNKWVDVDSLSLFFLLITSVLFSAASFGTVGYLRNHQSSSTTEGFFSREGVFIGTLMMFLATTTLAILSRHTGVFWLAIEATTLASGPLIAYQRSPQSLEAAWKYLLICSVGIAIVLVGNTALAVSSLFSPETEHIHMTFHDLALNGAALDPLWLKVAFAFILIGYGTKMGLAPMHSWLPDAYSEAPSPISALLSGALSNCAFLGVLRTNEILVKAGIGDYSGDLLIAFGIFSMLISGCLILHQSDFKRLLAYSSIEHMGILSVAIGAGASGAALFHALNNSLTKGSLFLVAGSVLGLYHTRLVQSVKGLVAIAPVTGVIWICGFLGICGVPPFGTFFSEIMVMSSLGAGERWAVLSLFLLSLAMVFVGMWKAVVPMVFGPGDRGVRGLIWDDIPPLVLCGGVLLLGLWVPGPLRALLDRAAAVIGGM